MDLSDVLSRPPRILIADDDWLNRDLLRTYLATSGCDVTIAPDGQAALDMALSDPPDLALLDIQMPRLDGVELCRTLKSTPETRFVPVIIVTAYDTDEEKIKAIDAGADDFITKPYNSIILLTRVRSLLRIKKLNDEIEARNTLLRQVLNRYVAEDVAEIILEDPDQQLQLGGETRTVTVLFADIRGFTPFSENYSAEVVFETLNLYLCAMIPPLLDETAILDKIIGDEVMAVFNILPTVEPAPNHAVKAAIRMLEAVSAVNDTRRDNDEPTLDIGVGIATGPVALGVLGSKRRKSISVIGSHVNLAARLQNVARPRQIVIDQNTFDQTSTFQKTFAPVVVDLKGFDKPVKVFCSSPREQYVYR